MKGLEFRNVAVTGRSPVISLVLTLFVLAGMGYVLYTGSRIQEVNLPQLRAAAEIEVQVVRAHLVLDEILAGDPKSRFEEVRAHLGQSEWLTTALLEGGHDGDWHITPIDDPEVNRQLRRTLARLDEFQDAAKRRLYLSAINREVADHGGNANSAFEGAWTSFNLSMQRTDAALRRAIDNKFRSFVRTQVALIFTCTLLGLLTAALFFRFEWLRSRQTSALLDANLRARENDKQLIFTVLRSVGEGVIATDRKGTVTVINPSAEHLTGIPRDEAMHRSIEEVLRLDGTREHPSSRHILYEVVAEETSLTMKDLSVLASDGSRCPVELTASPLLGHEGELAGMVLNFRDITERKEFEGKLEQMALFDGLTGLYNRSQFDRRLEEEFQRAVTYYDLPLSLLLIDVDHFKRVNDTHGHQVGDQYLIELAKLVIRHTRKVDLAARYGGEELAIILPQTTGEHALALAERLREQAEQMAVDAGGQAVSTTLSIGVASPQMTSAITPQQLLEAADRALYQAKNGGRNRVVLAGDSAPVPPLAGGKKTPAKGVKSKSQTKDSRRAETASTKPGKKDKPN
ncbi:MAG: diguanylate cyclase [Nitrospirota bacterium]|nr:diguanylate cyclase [Nitrospirota bacterium]